MIVMFICFKAEFCINFYILVIVYMYNFVYSQYIYTYNYIYIYIYIYNMYIIYIIYNIHIIYIYIIYSRNTFLYGSIITTGFLKQTLKEFQKLNDVYTNLTMHVYHIATSF